MEKNFPVTNRVLAVWGNPSCGKTVVSVKLAQHLAQKKKNVILVLTDMTAPPLPIIISPTLLECEKSLGGILSAAQITENLIYENSVTIKKRDHIVILGMLKGENTFSYPSYTKEQAMEFIKQLKCLDCHVVIDCTSNIATDTLSAIAIQSADKVLRLISCDLKAISYYSSQLPLILDQRFQAEKQIKVASNVKSLQAEEHVAAVFKGVSFSLPYTSEIERQYLDGDLFKDMTTREGRKYNKVIKSIVQEVFGIE